MEAPQYLTRDEAEEELLFQDVLLSTLDSAADDYDEKYREIMEKRQRLEGLLNSFTATERPVNQQYDDGSYIGEEQIPPGLKRPLPPSLDHEHNRASKVPTPEPLVPNPSIPESSRLDFGVNVPYSTERARLQQAQAEGSLRRQREAELADQELAMRLSRETSPPRSYPSSSKRQSVQTTIGQTVPYRPPLSQTAYEPHQQSLKHNRTLSMEAPSLNSKQSRRDYNIKTETEPGSSGVFSGSSNLSSSQSHIPPRVIDLTGDSDDESGSTPLFSTSNTSNSLSRTPRYPKPPPTQYPDSHYLSGYSNVSGYPRPYACHLPTNDFGYPQENFSNAFSGHVPGSYPGITYLNQPGAYPDQFAHPNSSASHLYGSPSNTHPTQSSHNSYYGLKGALSAVGSGINKVTGTFGNPLAEFGNLIHGSRSSPYQIDNGDEDEDDYDSAGFFPRQRFSSDYFDPYRQLENDPAKTREEINALLNNIRPDEDLPEHLRVQTPEALSIRLHKYQEVGLTWLQNCEKSSNLGGILADDMGLGKTIQMLSLMVTHKSEDPRCKTTLIVAPVALMRQWRQEIRDKLRPGSHSLTVFIQHGPSKKKSFRELQHFDVVLTTFGGVASEMKKWEKFLFRKNLDQNARPRSDEQCALIGEDSKWYRVILDEAQCIKNKNTQTAKGCSSLNAKYRFCVTGTPMMNNLEELYSLLKFLRVQPYCKWENFRVDFLAPMKSYHQDSKTLAMRKLQTLCKAVMLRRTKQSTFEGRPILVLPDRSTEVENPVFDDEERSFYDAIETKTQLQFNRYLDRGAVGQQYSAILLLLLRLRQACCHPHLIKDFGVSAVADVSPDQILDFARELSSAVVDRIKETGGNFECPVCYDAVRNPAIFLPCGHDTCAECFAKIADPSNAIRNGDESGVVRCPNCRGSVDPKRITDFNAFKKVHMPELLSVEEIDGNNVENDSDDDSDDSDTDDENDDEIDERGNLKNFIVSDDTEVADTDEADEDIGIKDEPQSTNTSNTPQNALQKGKSKAKGKKSAKGSEKRKLKKQAKTVTLAELKKLSTRNASARKKYIRRLRKDWITSAKIEKTMDLLKKIMADPKGEKVLIFSQWTSLLDLLEVPIDDAGWGYRRYDGSMNSKMRNDAVDDFRDASKNARIMLVSLKAGNAGLNLNMASQVVILDPFWNPYIEEQAIDRAHRIGQTRPVTVHRMLVEGTVEDRIVALQEKKRALINEALDENASQNIARLGVQELAYLFGITSSSDQRVAARHAVSNR